MTVKLSNFKRFVQFFYDFRLNTRSRSNRPDWERVGGDDDSSGGAKICLLHVRISASLWCCSSKSNQVQIGTKDRQRNSVVLFVRHLNKINVWLWCLRYHMNFRHPIGLIDEKRVGGLLGHQTIFDRLFSDSSFCSYFLRIASIGYKQSFFMNDWINTMIFLSDFYDWAADSRSKEGCTQYRTDTNFKGAWTDWKAVASSIHTNFVWIPPSLKKIPFSVETLTTLRLATIQLCQIVFETNLTANLKGVEVAGIGFAVCEGVQTR